MWKCLPGQQDFGESIARDIGLDAGYAEFFTHQNVEAGAKQKMQELQRKTGVCGDGIGRITDAPFKIGPAIRMAKKQDPFHGKNCFRP